MDSVNETDLCDQLFFDLLEALGFEEDLDNPDLNLIDQFLQEETDDPV